ncbi:uncharacterized protein LOC120538229 isoform X2 [Polypterus senegalus]|uniref:uncharacterized protein LOC120538229 isoform X2 n=1 Tax=Polypterus senegalus TaxID=55291 RepID=UPI001966AA1D|nr:uncharacterized protein LOC120538229 isoform X2 [Polypterus senegalus]
MIPTEAITATAGVTVNLECNLGKPENRWEVKWYKLSGNMQRSIIDPKNCKSSFCSLERISTLVLENVTADNSGEYICGLEPTAGPATDIKKIIVRVQAGAVKGIHMKIIQSPTILNTPVGSDVTLACFVHGNAHSGFVRWFREVKPQSRNYFFSSKETNTMRNHERVDWVNKDIFTDRSLKFKTVQAKDSGKYYCKYYMKLNKQGMKIQEELVLAGHGTELHVQDYFPEKVNIHIKYIPESVSVTEASSVTLICLVYQHDSHLGALRWFRETEDGKEAHFYSESPKDGMKNDPRVVGKQEDNREYFNFTITINGVMPQDSGKYYCHKYKKVVSSKGEERLLSGVGTTLTVDALPFRPPTVTLKPPVVILQPYQEVRGFQNEKVTLHCFVSAGIVNGIMRWYRITSSRQEYIYSAMDTSSEKIDPRVRRTDHHYVDIDWSITIEDLTLMDNGMYFCELDDGFEEKHQVVVGGGTRLIVEEPHREAELTTEAMTTTPPLPRCNEHAVPWPICDEMLSSTGVGILSKSISEFGFNVYRILKDTLKEPNVVFSPLSIAIALSNLLLGTRGETLSVLNKALNYPKHFTCVHQEMGNLIQSDSNLLIASAIYYHSGLKLHDFFLEQSKEYYGVAMPLTNDMAENVQLINKWVAEKTQNKITHLVNEIMASAEMLLLNAIYFKGKWKVKFQEDETKPKTFMRFGQSSKKTVLVPMMEHDKYPLALIHSRALNAKVARFRLSNESSLVLILPNVLSPTALSQVQSKLKTEDFLDMVKQLNKEDESDVIVSIPKLNLNTKTDLKSVLEKLGLSDLFSSPNLCGMSSENGLLVSDASHQAVIELHENGVEAAGSTSISLSRTVYTFEAHRPFMFVLWDDRHGLPVFMGHVTDPSYGQVFL